MTRLTLGCSREQQVLRFAQDDKFKVNFESR